MTPSLTGEHDRGSVAMPEGVATGPGRLAPGTQSSGARRRGRINRFVRGDALFGFALTVPALVVLAAFTARPLVQTVVLSFAKQDLTRPELGTRFVGLANWQRMFTLTTFPTVLTNTVLLALCSAAAQIVLGLAVALLLNRGFRLRPVARAAAILPWAMPTIAAAFAFRWLFDVSFGPINKVLDLFGLGPVGWLSNESTALTTVIIAHVWKGLPFVILVMLAALQTAPKELYEAGRVDGCGPWQEFRYVTLPHLRYILAITFVLRLIWTFNWFDFTFLLTGGGPGQATRTLPLEVYISAFRTYNLGMASTYATFMALVLLVFAVLFLRLSLREGKPS